MCTADSYFAMEFPERVGAGVVLQNLTRAGIGITPNDALGRRFDATCPRVVVFCPLGEDMDQVSLLRAAHHEEQHLIWK